MPSVNFKVKESRYCIICGQRIYKKAFLNWLCQYLSFLDIFFNRFYLVERCGVTPHLLYRDSLTLRVMEDYGKPSKNDFNLSVFSAQIWYWHHGLLCKLELCGGSLGKLLDLLTNYLHERVQKVVLNDHLSTWESILSGAPESSVLSRLLFLIYIIDLPHQINSIYKIFADDTSLLSLVHDKNSSRNKLNNDLQKINDWNFQWKMTFNPYPNKQAQEVYFSKKI